MQKNRQGTSLNRIRETLVVAARIMKDQGMASLFAQSIEKLQKREFTVTGPSVPDEDYAKWIANNETNDTDLIEQRSKALQFRYRPLVSIVVPVWNPPIDSFTETIESVLAQTYDNWELCIADGNSNSAIKEIISKLRNQQNRVRAEFLASNQGISLNSNAAIQLCNGEFTALLDHDDLLAPNALFEVVKCLNSNYDVDYIYSDMDHMTNQGKRTDPLFKPDWSPDMMLCSNYATHLSVIRSELLKNLGGLRTETDGAQDWDLILRISENTDRIFHIPKILYHWRQTPSSASFAGLRAKPYAKKSQVLALEGYLARNQIPGSIKHEISGFPRIVWDIISSTIVTIILVDDGTLEELYRCTRSILKKSSYENMEIIIVTKKDLSHNLGLNDQKVRVLKTSGPLDFPAASNLGAAQARGQVLLFLDRRIEISASNWLQELVGWCSQPKIGVTGLQLISQGTIVHGGIVIGLPGFLFQGAQVRWRSPIGDSEWYRNCSAVSKYCLAVRRSLFREIGPFNGSVGELADVQFCLRARTMGYRTLLSPRAKLIFHNSSRGVAEQVDVFRKYHELATGPDPYFNPNLSYDHAMPTLKV